MILKRMKSKTIISISLLIVLLAGMTFLCSCKNKTEQTKETATNETTNDETTKGEISKVEAQENQVVSETDVEGTIVDVSKGDANSMEDEKSDVIQDEIPIEDLDWLGTWASAQQGLDPSRGEYPPEPGLANNTFRQILRISVGGSTLRLKISNEYGKTPLVINSVHMAKLKLAGYSIIDTNAEIAVTFEGSESVTIPAGEIMTSDVINFQVADLERLAVTMYFGEVPEMVTSHTGARTTNYVVEGNHISDEYIKEASTCEAWYFITAIDVMASKEGKSIVCLGDSITDGRGVRTNNDERWTDILAQRLVENESTKNRSVLNQGIGGNSIFGGLGPAAYKRYERDVLEQQGVGYVIIFEGINDIGYANSLSMADKMIEKYISFAEQAHERGIKVYGATITPFEKFGSYYTNDLGELREEIRQTVNEWIRTNEYFDGVIDMDAILRDEDNPSMLAYKYSSDGLHPNFKGYEYLGNQIDLTLFED